MSDKGKTILKMSKYTTCIKTENSPWRKCQFFFKFLTTLVFCFLYKIQFLKTLCDPQRKSNSYIHACLFGSSKMGRPQIHDCGNRETEHYHSFLEIRRLRSFISRSTQIGTRHLYWILTGPLLAMQITDQLLMQPRHHPPHTGQGDPLQPLLQDPPPRGQGLHHRLLHGGLGKYSTQGTKYTR